MTGFLYMPERTYPLRVFVFVAHTPAFDSGFHYDDRHSLLDNPQIGDLGQISRFSPIPPLFLQIRAMQCTASWC